MNLNVLNTYASVRRILFHHKSTRYQGVKHSYFFLFSDKIPIFQGNSYFFLNFGHFAFNFGILLYFYHHYFTQEHFKKNFSLLSLSNKILFPHIMVQSIGTADIPPLLMTIREPLIDRMGDCHCTSCEKNWKLSKFPRKSLKPIVVFFPMQRSWNPAEV